MGFSVYLLIVHPHVGKAERMDPKLHPAKKSAHRPFKQYTLWEIEEIIAIGDVTRLEKLTNKNYGLSYSSRQRAGICVAGELLDHLWKKCQHPKLTDFAPSFAVDPIPGMTLNGYAFNNSQSNSLDWSLKHLRFDMLKGGEEFVKPIFHHYANQQVPDQLKMEEHNNAIQSNGFQQFIKGQYQIIMQSPFMWQRSSVVARWLHEMEDKQTENWRELVNDRRAMYQMIAWRSYLEEIAKLDTRMLFVFNSINRVSVL